MSMEGFTASGILTLSSDFGHGSPYTGQMKGSALKVSGEVRIFDLWHEIPFHDVKAGAFLLPRMVGAFPDGTVHVCVVDPGVGTGRKPILVEWEGFVLVGPDNGLFSIPLEKGGRARIIDPGILGSVKISSTFHGRDIFAPFGAMLAAGKRKPGDFELLEDPVTVPLPVPFKDENGDIHGEVVFIDPFGNLVTNIDDEYIEAGSRTVYVKNKEVPIATTYGSVGKGELLGLVDSFGLLEIAVSQGSAARVLGAGPGEDVCLVKEGIQSGVAEGTSPEGRVKSKGPGTWAGRSGRSRRSW